MRCLFVGQRYMGFVALTDHTSHGLKGYPSDPKTIGEAMRKRRLDLGLRQIDVANLVGCNEMTVVNWEKGYTNLRPDKIARVKRFLASFKPLSP